MVNIQMKQKNKIPPKERIAWYSEHPDVYYDLLQGETVVVPMNVAQQTLGVIVVPNYAQEETDEVEDIVVEDSDEAVEKEADNTIEEEADNTIEEEADNRLTIDDLKDVKGIGEVKAQEILDQYKTQEALQENINNLDLSDAVKERLQKKFADPEEDNIKEE